ncbi:MAG: hypothetical protein VB082_10415 [Christensenella sp.]|nr:hypothetical protein [Christensenella sp.]
MKKILVKIVACTAVIALGIGILGGCAQIYGKAGKMMQDITDISERAVEKGSILAEKAIDTLNKALDTGASAAETALDDIDEFLEKADNSLKEYEPFGVSYSEANRMYWYQGKPVAGLYDEGHHTMVNGFYGDIGIFVIAERDSAGALTGVREISKKEFVQAVGVDEIDNAKEAAKRMEYDFAKEDISVAELGAKEFEKLKESLRAAHNGENIVIECNDYVFWFHRS